jgi:hypothetical protein
VCKALAVRVALICLRSLKAGGDSEHFSSQGMNMLQVIPALEILLFMHLGGDLFWFCMTGVIQDQIYFC